MFVKERVPINGVTAQHTAVFIQRHCFMLVFSEMKVESLRTSEKPGHRGRATNHR
jgi:hypothetical protein